MTRNDFETILKIADETEKDPLTAARIKFAITLLYSGGLRISNLLILTTGQIDTLLKQGKIQISLIKKGAKRHNLCIGTQGMKDLNALHKEYTLFKDNQPDLSQLFFVPNQQKQQNTETPITAISRSLFDKQINRVLAKTSTQTGKHIRSHSFRASIITDMLDKRVPIEQVKHIIGHKDIRTTAGYNRTTMTTKDIDHVISKVHKARKNNFQIKRNQIIIEDGGDFEDMCVKLTPISFLINLEGLPFSFVHKTSLSLTYLKHIFIINAL
uniref:Putative recombinase/integrase protein n=2 Tax=Roya TaxID=43942 RepID=A0A024B4Z0_9VIRI|nr:putative recombinase/integrase protein [Roya anglica]YP_009033777.1 putative recombinase/integrase protein [Roya anglica]YP_009256922.1 putative recombinase/integrase [Roya obtusa]YP_009256937.1 putative recombinase/integrase [Roya obtusa]AHZ11143.1 putative recombinase/integrase protein [Roya anglica]AHZ11160.1 putative recombinase/integrase protein [Roya anglica]ANI25997.1 putative recombinase/integrase [Roya obtusa]ANI25998.1 putative recombinase/integrase [Roya obtusa]